jgi:hypothetical protein
VPLLVDEILRKNFLFGTHQAAGRFGTILNLFFHSVKDGAQVVSYVTLLSIFKPFQRGKEAAQDCRDLGQNPANHQQMPSSLRRGTLPANQSCKRISETLKDG